MHGVATSRFGGRAKLRYVFTIEDVRLSCGSALLQAAGSMPPTIALKWKSGRKQVSGGVTRALGPQDGAGAGALWPRPVSLACSLTSSKATGQRFEPRHSEIVLKVEGAKAARRKLVGTLDLAAHASFERVSTRLTVPLSHGAGSLQATTGHTLCARVRVPNTLESLPLIYPRSRPTARPLLILSPTVLAELGVDRAARAG